MLLLPYVGSKNVGRMWKAKRYALEFRELPHLTAALPEMLFHEDGEIQHSYKQCGLLETLWHAGGADTSLYRLCAAQCQCDTRTTRRCRHAKTDICAAFRADNKPCKKCGETARGTVPFPIHEPKNY